MSQIWIEKLRNARTEVERDEILLRDLRDTRRALNQTQATRLYEEVQDQLRALAALAFPR